jgi:hypothetical protein
MAGRRVEVRHGVGILLLRIAASKPLAALPKGAVAALDVFQFETRILSRSPSSGSWVKQNDNTNR